MAGNDREVLSDDLARPSALKNVRARRGRLRRVGPICLADALVDTFEGFVDARNVCVG